MASQPDTGKMVWGSLLFLGGTALLGTGIYQAREEKRLVETPMSGQARKIEEMRIRARVLTPEELNRYYGRTSKPVAQFGGSGATIALMGVGIILMIVGIVVFSWAFTIDTMYPFNYGTAFPVHSEPGVLRTEVIGNLL